MMRPMTSFDSNLHSSFDELTWAPDELGEGFERTTIPLGADPDGEAPVQTVLVRALPDEPTGKPALLWVHGMSDYFFQTHVAKHYLELGYPFYGVDLRKCGRAHQAGQRWHYTSDMRYYHPDLTAVANLLASRHGSVIPMGHSTGGLTVVLWADDMRRNDPATHDKIGGLILNSPWVDMQFPGWLVTIIRPLVSILGKRFPDLKIPVSGEATYGQSIYAGAQGRWEYDTDKKRLGGHDKYMGWIRAVMESQALIHDDKIDAGVPTLTLCSDESHLGKPFDEKATRTDTVLDVDQIQNRAPQLSSISTTAVIDGALHDVFLSKPEVLDEAYRVVDDWLAHVAAPEER